MRSRDDGWSRRMRWLLGSCAALLAWHVAGTPAALSQEAKEPSLEAALKLMYEARKAYAGVGDYTCTLIKRESIPTNPDDNIMLMKFRGQPFSVYMRWVAPAKYRGQEVAYFHGRNRNKLRVHAKGFFKGIAGFVSVDVNDRRISECSRHNIYEAGIGYMIEKTIQHWEKEKLIGKTRVAIDEYEFNKRRCWRVETTHSERRAEFYCYRTILYIDQETKLPIRNENYGWPQPGGAAEGDLIEMFSYVDLRLNVGLTDRDFDK